MTREEPSLHWEITDQCLFLRLWPTQGSGHESKDLREFNGDNQPIPDYRCKVGAAAPRPTLLQRWCFLTSILSWEGPVFTLSRYSSWVLCWSLYYPIFGLISRQHTSLTPQSFRLLCSLPLCGKDTLLAPFAQHTQLYFACLRALDAFLFLWKPCLFSGSVKACWTVSRWSLIMTPLCSSPQPFFLHSIRTYIELDTITQAELCDLRSCIAGMDWLDRSAAGELYFPRLFLLPWSNTDWAAAFLCTQNMQGWALVIPRSVNWTKPCLQPIHSREFIDCLWN